MRLSLKFASLALFAYVFHAPASALPGDSERPWPETLRNYLQTMTDIEDRLRREAGPACPAMAPALGLALDHIGEYAPGDKAYVQSVLAMGDDFVAAGVAPGGAAARAGLRQGDVILAVNGTPLGTIAAPRKGTRLDAVKTLIEQAGATGEVRLRVGRGSETSELAARPDMLCATHFVVRTTDAIEWHSDDNNLSVSTGLMAFSANVDEVALAAGHELGHILKRHPKHGSARELRQMEDEADIEGARLAACAGFDMRKAIEFWPRLGKRHWATDWLRIGGYRTNGARYRQLKAWVDRDNPICEA